MQYKGTFTDIFAALKAFPNGAGDDDFVVISGKIHRWSKHKGTFVTDTVHAPEMPDNNPCITLFTSLTNSGILTDYMGNRWQLSPFAERVSMPAITVEDVTTDTTYGYPELTGQRNAVYLITIEDEDDECDIEYKIIKDGNEPAVWEAYDEPFIIRNNGVYQIAARARKSGVADSEIARSDAFQVIRKKYATDYDNIQITQFTYGTLDATLGTKTPTLIYAQPVIERYTDGTSASPGAIIVGAAISYRLVNSDTGYSALNTSNGTITYTANPNLTQRTIATVEVTVSLNSKTKTANVAVVQAGVEATDNVIIWDTDPSSGAHSIGDTVNFAAHTADGAVLTFKKGNTAITPITKTGDVYSGSVTLSDATTVITANAAAVGVHRATTSSKTVNASPVQEVAYYGFSAAVPDSVSTSNSQNIPSTVSVQTQFSDAAKCHWVAVKTASGYRVTALTDEDNDSIIDQMQTKTIGIYTVYYYYSEYMNIQNTSNFKIEL